MNVQTCVGVYLRRLLRYVNFTRPFRPPKVHAPGQDSSTACRKGRCSPRPRVWHGQGRCTSPRRSARLSSCTILGSSQNHPCRHVAFPLPLLANSPKKTNTYLCYSCSGLCLVHEPEHKTVALMMHGHRHHCHQTTSISRRNARNMTCPLRPPFVLPLVLVLMPPHPSCRRPTRLLLCSTPCSARATHNLGAGDRSATAGFLQ